jgi:putative ABC transport system substrate-binding protein
MRRREFIGSLICTAVAWPLAASAQQSAMPVIGLLSGIADVSIADTGETRRSAIRRGLSEQGYIEGRNVRFAYRFADGHYDRLPGLATELVSMPVTVIAAIGGSPSAIAAKAATSTIPIVFALGVDPVERGLVASYSSPGGNLTGLTDLDKTLTPKQLELLDELLPKTALVAEFVNPTNPNMGHEVGPTRDAARTLGRELIIVEASAETEIDAAFETLARQRVGGLLVGSEAFFTSQRDQIVKLAQHHGIPAIYTCGICARAGGLMSYAPNYSDLYHQVGVYIGKILNGARPADLPVLQPTTYELIINLKTAKELGITIPPSIMVRADEVIE